MADEMSTNADASTELKRVRPTLYVALGGTGKEVLLRLRRRILETLWNGHRVEKLDDFKVASFLYFDLYQGKAEEEKKSASGTAVEDPLSALVDLPKGDCIQTRMDTSKYLKGREIDRFPHVKEWLPAGDLRSIRAEDGAGQVRALSRPVLLRRRRQDQRRDQQQVDRTAQQRLQQRGPAAARPGVEPQVQVIVVCSVAGGTGSGSFIDMGYLAKSMQSVKLDGVSLYAVLGGAFFRPQPEDTRQQLRGADGTRLLHAGQPHPALRQQVDRHDREPGPPTPTTTSTWSTAATSATRAPATAATSTG